MLSDWLRPYLVERLQEWLYEQRNFYLPSARPLSDEEKSRLSGYFEKRILDLTRIASIDRILNPEFYDDLAKSGVPIPLDFTQAVGLTLLDCVLICKGLWANPSSLISTLFHEMVHVVQFDILGPRKLILLYANQLLRNDYQYHSVLLEKQAYSLSDRFVKGESPFSVSEILKKELEYAK